MIGGIIFLGFVLSVQYTVTLHCHAWLAHNPYAGITYPMVTESTSVSTLVTMVTKSTSVSRYNLHCDKQCTLTITIIAC